jgi:outer membrane protein assembly factor BamA
MGTPFRLRHVRNVAAVIAATTVLAAVGLHTPMVRARALTFLLARLAESGFIAHADRLDYDILTRTVRLSGLTLAVPSAADAPFLAARDVTISLPWSAIRGPFSLERVAIVSPRVTLRRDANGRDNWTPGPHDTSSTGPLTLHIGRASLTDVIVDWTDAQTSSHVDAAFSLDLTAKRTAIAGAIAMAQPARVRWRERSTTIELTSGLVSWNDRDLALEGVALRAPEGTVRVDARIDEVLGAARVDARLDVDARLAELSPWLDLERTIPGTVRASARVDAHGVDVTGVRAVIVGGEATGQARLSFDGTGSAHVTWTRLDLPEILRYALKSPLEVPPSSRIDGDLDARWSSSRLDDLQLRANGRLIGERHQRGADTRVDPYVGADRRVRPESADVPGRRRELPVDAVVALELQRSHWKLAATSVDAFGVHANATLAGTLNTGDLQQSSIGGTITARTTDDREWPRALVRAGLVDSEPPVSGPLAAEFLVTGTLAAPSLSGPVEATLRHASVPASTIRGRAMVTKDALALTDVDARIAGSTARGSIRWATGSDEIAGTVTGALRLADLPSLLPSIPPSLALDGAVDLTAALAGSLAQPRVAIHGAGEGIQLAGQTIDRFTTEARLDGRQLTVERLLAESEGGRLEASALVHLARDTYTTRAAVENLPIHPLLDVSGERGTPLTGTLNGTFEGSGSFQQLGGRGRVSMTDARWRDADFGTVNSDVTLVGRMATFTIDARDVALQGRGSVGLDADGAMSVSATWEPQDVAAVIERLSLNTPIAGSAALALDWNGTRDHIDRGRAQVSVNRAEITVADQALRLTQPGRIDADSNAIRITPIVLVTGSSTLTIDGTLGDASAPKPLTLMLDGALADFGFIRDIVQPRADGEPAPPRLAGSIRGAITAQGTMAAPRISGAFEVRDGVIPVTDRAPVSAIEIGARYDDGVVVGERAAAAFEGATLTATARVPSAVFIERLPDAVRRWIPTASGPATLSAQVRSITSSVAAPFVDAGTLEQIALHSDASIDLEADRPDFDRVRGAVVLSRAELSLAGVAFDQQAPTRLAIAGGRVTVESWTWGRDDNRVVLRGGLALGADPALDLTATAALDLRLLNAFAPAARTSGRADAEIHVGGTAKAPALDGYLTLSDGDTRIANPRLVVDDLNGTVMLGGDTLSLRGVSATVNGGSAEVTGSFHHRWLVPLDGAITLTAKGSALEISGLRAEADAALTWTLDANSSTVGGSVTLVRSAYREQLTIAGNLLAALRRSSTPIAADATNQSLAQRTRLDVRLVTDEDLLIDNNVARLTLHGDLRAVGAATNPSLTGRMEFGEGGTVFFNGTRYRLSDRRSIDFANPTRIDPDLDLSAVARVQNYEITISLKGTPATLESTLVSNDPYLSQSDMVSLLLVGRKATGGDTPGGDELVGLLTGNFLEAAGRAIGFDTARVERGTPELQFDAGLVATETDPGTRLTFGKTIGTHFELVFSQSLQQSGGLTWIVGYKPRAGVDLRLVTLDDNDRLYTFSHDISIGGSRPRAASRAVPSERVTEVAITGAGTDEAALRSRLKLQANDRFSFFQWQDDRERLEAFFHERERFEARIAARRTADPAAAARVRLAYEVRPGPRTTISVDGFSLSASAITVMERAWARSVVDDFLIDEVAAIARAELADAGYLLPTVTARLEAGSEPASGVKTVASGFSRTSGPPEGGLHIGFDTGLKQLRITIEPGEHARQRRVAFSGNTNEPSARLLAALAERGLTRAVWTDPDPVRRALTAFYRSNGYLSASFLVGDVTVADDTAVRPIQIVEGDAFRVGTVRIEGVHAFTPEEAAQFAGLSEGERYLASRLEAAQLALDTQYRARGFNRVAIDYQAAVAPGAPEVAVLVRVDEGPQQRLREVATKGLERTNPTLLSRSLIELKIGEPVDLAAWNAARRRAYETGAFRNVDIQREVLSSTDPATSGSAPAEEAVRATVTVQEWPPLRLRYGLEVRDELDAAGDAARSNTIGTEAPGGRTFGIGVAGDLGARGLFGRAISAGVAGRYAPNSRVARLYATSPLFFGRRIASTAFLERSREVHGRDPDSNLLPFEAIITELTLEQRVRFARRTTLSYGYTRERNHTRGLEPDDPLDLVETIGYFSSAGIFDTRDDPTDPTRGWFHSSSLQYAPAWSNQQFVRYFVQQQYFRRADRIVFATAARVGLGRGFGAALVPSKRFFAGGGNSVRGYAEDVLSPVGILGDVAGGHAVLVVNQEVRFPVFKMIRGVGFFDAGRPFDRVSNVSLDALATSAGLGLRVQTPFVLLRIDMGVPFDAAFGPRHPRWFISIGQMF